ncbi:MAG TPA: GTP 3',8-cyclase MoaA [Clostridiales bacterium]|nr:GTP 3',8-cyclase MoaA [Clostridiales bacterium]
MIDHYSRLIDYMRISITDRCNLRCSYCMPDGIEKLEHESILTYEEILRICSCASEVGIRNIKITGGEPLVRKDAVKLISWIKALPKIEHVTLTTNGVLLEQYIDELKEIPVDGINVSLDTLNPETFEQITGRDDYFKVWNSIQKLIESGIPAKINCVPQRGVNDQELMDIAELAVKQQIDVRFIEMMPIGHGRESTGIRGEEIHEMIRGRYPGAVSTSNRRGFGPAVYITADDWKGNIGFISPISHKFCSSCNRIRLTSRGFLKPCLCYGNGIDLMAAIRHGASNQEITELITGAIRSKPLEHRLGDHNQEDLEKNEMYKIGG